MYNIHDKLNTFENIKININLIHEQFNIFSWLISYLDRKIRNVNYGDLKIIFNQHIEKIIVSQYMYYNVSLYELTKKKPNSYSITNKNLNVLINYSEHAQYLFML